MLIRPPSTFSRFGERSRCPRPVATHPRPVATHPRPVATKRSTARSDALEGGGSMSLTDREWWAVIHGMILGAIFLLAFAGGNAECTGPQEDRPASCQSQGGPEDKP
jgi:hypothetical protein